MLDLSFCQTLLNATINEKETTNTIPQESSEEISTEISDELKCADDESSSSERNVWSYSATVALINSMETHFEDLSHATKKKYVFSNVSNDILSLGHKYNAGECNTKWKTLVRSYKTIKDKKAKTGRAQTRFMFFELIDNILGDKPTNQCLHSLESSAPQEESEEEKKETDEVVNIHSESKERKRKRTSENCIKLKEKEYMKKEQRHRERMEVEQSKLETEKRKIALLEQLLKQ